MNELQIHDDFEQELLEVRTLIEAAVTKHRERRAQNVLVMKIEPDTQSVPSAVTELINQSSCSVDVALAADTETARSVFSAIDTLMSAYEQQVSVRIVCTHATLDREFAARHSKAGHPVEVRVSRMPPLSVLIVDSRIALVRADSAVRQQASVIQAAAVIHSLQALLDNVWKNATAVSDPIDFGDHARAGTFRHVLECLRAGVTDEAAAREVSMSIRTYRRYVAEIMSLLNADSRFQAGVRATELGLLPPPR